MYAVVGCDACDAFWVVADDPETTQCPRCGKRHRQRKLKRFYETEDADAARQARATLLARRSGHGEAFEGLDSFAEMGGRLDDAGVDDDTYLRESGLDAEAVAAAGDRAGGGSGGSPSREETVRDALRALDAPDEERVVTYADERGVPPEASRTILTKLVRAGDASESGGVYRLL